MALPRLRLGGPKKIHLGVVPVNFDIGVEDLVSALDGVKKMPDITERAFPCHLTGRVVYEAFAVDFGEPQLQSDLERYGEVERLEIGMPKSLLTMLSRPGEYRLRDHFPLLAPGGTPIRRGARHAVCAFEDEGVLSVANTWARTHESWNGSWRILYLRRRADLYVV